MDIKEKDLKKRDRSTFKLLGGKKKKKNGKKKKIKS